MDAIQLSFDYSTGFAPAFDYDYISQYAQRDVNDINVTVHYHNCACFYCTDAHFPCDDWDCDYCNIVRIIRDQEYTKQYNNGANHYDIILPRVDKSYDNIISYNTYMAWGDREHAYSDMRWRSCSNCNLLIDGLTSDDYDTCCSEDCKVQYEADQVIYCASCGESEVSEDGELCQYCERDHASEDMPYRMGEVLDSDDYGYTTEAWIAPNGDLHYVPEYNTYGIGHDETAMELGYSGTNDIERAGYIHVSTYYNRSRPFHYIPSRYTDAQVDTAMLLCDAHRWNYPPFVKTWLDKHNSNDSHEIIIHSMQNLSSSWLMMTRKQRDQFYPLSGD